MSDVPKQLQKHVFKPGNTYGKGKARSYERAITVRLTQGQLNKLELVKTKNKYKNYTDAIRLMINSYVFDADAKKSP